jgi:hypothetical protein
MNIYLCAGLGGQAVKNDENITVDIDRKTKPTIIADVRSLPLRHGLQIQNLLMTPPCTYLSKARNPWPREGIKWNLEVVGACLEAAAHLKPEAWFLENPNGNLKRIIGPADADCVYNGGHYSIKNKRTQFWTNDKRALQRALIPKDLTKRLLNPPVKMAKPK